MSLSRKSTDKISNTGRFHVIKNRFCPDGMTFPSRVDTSAGMIEIYDEKSTNGAEIMVEMNNADNSAQGALRQRYNQMNQAQNDEDLEELG